MLLDLNGLEKGIAHVGEYFNVPISYTIEVYYIPGIGVKQNAVFWVEGQGTKSNPNVFELFADVIENKENIKFDPAH